MSRPLADRGRRPLCRGLAVGAVGARRYAADPAGRPSASPRPHPNCVEAVQARCLTPQWLGPWGFGRLGMKKCA
jgi:hypothetical protein